MLLFIILPAIKKRSKRHLKSLQQNLCIFQLKHNVQPPILVPFFYWWGDDPPTKFSKWGGGGRLDRIHIFGGELLGLRGVTFFRGGLQFYLKNKLKSEIFNNKKKVKNKNNFSIITKNLNW